MRNLQKKHFDSPYDANSAGRNSLFVGSIVHVFEKTYGFSGGQGGTVLITGKSHTPGYLIRVS
jgi:hypothetical protein